MNVDKVINGNQCTDAARAAENAGIRSSGFAIATGDPDKLLGILSRGRGEWGRGLNVIVCPGLANDGPDQVDQVDRTRAAHLALDFAQHVPDIERNEIAEPVLAACLEYVEAAHEAIDPGEVPPRLPQAKERLVARRARWEEARRQVLHILATEPGPRGEAG